MFSLYLFISISLAQDTEIERNSNIDSVKLVRDGRKLLE